MKTLNVIKSGRKNLIRVINGYTYSYFSLELFSWVVRKNPIFYFKLL